MPNSPFPPGARVVAYLRDSGHEDQELSVAQQEAALRAWCEAQNIILTRIYTDAAAPGSSTIGREQFLAMISHFRAGCEEAGILLWKFSRFARDIDDAQFYKADLRRRGYTIHAIQDPIPEGLNGRFFEAALDWMNARYLEDLRTDIKRGQRHLLLQYGALGGTPPKGFMRQPVEIGTRRDGRPHIVHRWVPDPALADQVRLAWQMRAEGASYKAINDAVHFFNSRNSWVTFFKNRLYLGELVFEDLVIPDYCTPLIDRATWDAVQARSQSDQLSGPQNTSHPRRDSSSFLLSGLVHCARCGAALNGEVVSFKSTAKYRYTYYACSGQQRATGCDAKKIPQDILENTVLETLSEFVLHPRTIEAHHRQYEADLETAFAQVKAKRAQLNRQLSQVNRQIENLTDAIALSGGSPALLARLAKEEREQTRLKTDLARLRIETAPPASASLEDIQRRAAITREILAYATPDEVRKILTGIVHRITAERDGISIFGLITYYYPPKDPSSDNLCLCNDIHLGYTPIRIKFEAPIRIQYRKRS
jgi:site-specific DNA recombinase